MFHFGGEDSCPPCRLSDHRRLTLVTICTGSTQCCVVRKGVKLKGLPEAGDPLNYPVRAQLV
jgi:hypothetical protein